MGKIDELSYHRSFSYSTEGQLLGHMILELETVNRRLELIPDFPRDLKVMLQHMIISHHGEYEFGSPKLPMFPEALLLHCLDNLDSKLESMRGILKNDRNVDGDWTGHNLMFGRPIFKGKPKSDLNSDLKE
jgi:3'-5' exoribonuclease